MSAAQYGAVAGGLIPSVLIGLYFWFAPKAQTRAAMSASGAQEVAITVKGGYAPDVIVVQKGQIRSMLQAAGFDGAGEIEHTNTIFGPIWFCDACKTAD